MDAPYARLKVVLATFGTHGDLHPFIAISLALRQRGVEPTLMAAEIYREKVEAEGIRFRRMRPDLYEVGARLDMNQQAMVRAVARRPEFLIEKILLPHLRETYDDVMDATADADLVVTHSAAYGAKLAAEKRGLPNVGIALQPMILMSVYDPPIIGVAPRISRWVYRRGLTVTRAFIGLGKWIARGWAKPIVALRKDIGLPDTGAHPLFEGQYGDDGVIALFSPLLGEVQPDHPRNLRIVGFAFYDTEVGGPPRLSPELDAFLQRGVAPIVFTQGTSAVQDADHFIGQSLAAVRILGERAVFVLDAERAQQWAAHASKSILITGYAPYSLLFPRARANVHHGGVGTTAQALRAGRPQLIAPHLVDQPDNAARVARLGVARVLELGRYRADAIAAELAALAGASYCSRAAALGARIAREDGAGAAAEMIVDVLKRSAAAR